MRISPGHLLPTLIFVILALPGLSSVTAATDGAPQQAAPQQLEWESLFDGKSLKGWQGDDELWRVENGIIIGEGPAGGPVPATRFLWHEKSFDDFVFEAEFRITGGNSGIQYRSEAVPGGAAKGYQADLDAGHTYTGILYEANGRAILSPRGEVSQLQADGSRLNVGYLGGTAPLIDQFDPKSWHRYRIIARGNRARHELDGVQVCAFEDLHGNHQPAGKIGLQIHAGEPMRIEWRQIRIRPWQPLDGDPFADASRTQEVVTDDGPQWIWSSEEVADRQEVVLSRRFMTDADSSARLMLTADNFFIAFLDGEPILRGSDWTQIHDHRFTLTAGEHQLVVRASNESGPAGVAGTLSWTASDGGEERIDTDERWQVRRWTPSRASAEERPDDAAPESVEVPGSALHPNHGVPYGKDVDWSLTGIDPEAATAVKIIGATGDPSLPWGNVRFPNTAVRSWSLPQGFAAEIIHEVDPKDGSWVCIEPETPNSFIVSPQYSSLKRLRFGADGSVSVKECARIGSAQGLLIVGDELWVHVNGDAKKEGGLWVLTDTDHDGFFETEERLSKMGPGWEHGVHALEMGPAGHVWTVVGNHIIVPEEIITRDRYRRWQEDMIVPRMWDPSGHAVGYLAPAGQVLRIDPKTREWERVAGGFRNPYDIAFHHDGALFTYDADMEYDIGSPWYKAPRVVEVVSGGDAGWRAGDGKWPDGIPDAVPPAAESDLSSPTGVESGLQSLFQGRWRHAIYIADWAYGRILAYFPTEKGSSFVGEIEPFASAPALNVADITFGMDGAMYGVTGGRGTRSTVFRIRSKRPAEEIAAPITEAGEAARRQRRLLEAGHVESQPELLGPAISALKSRDPFIAAAARITLEEIDPMMWRHIFLGPTPPPGAVHGLLALARLANAEDQDPILRSLCNLPLPQNRSDELAQLRLITVAVARMGDPDDYLRQALLTRIDRSFPRRDGDIDRLLGDLLVRLQAPDLAARLLEWLEQGPTSDDRMAALRTLQWVPLADDERRRIAPVLDSLRTLPGGNSYTGFIDRMARQLDDGEGDLVPPPAPAPVMPPFVQRWTRESILEALQGPGGDPREGRVAYEKSLCARCHRFDGSGGGAGPDLTGIAGRFSTEDLITAIIDPSRDISDQYQWSVIEHGNDALEVGRILLKEPNHWVINTDPFGYLPVEIREPIRSVEASPVSPMPGGLLDGLDAAGLRNLWAYLGMTSR